MAFFQRRLRLGSNEQFVFCCFQSGRVNVGLAIHFWAFWMPKKIPRHPVIPPQFCCFRYVLWGPVIPNLMRHQPWTSRVGRLGLMSRVCWDFIPCKTARYQSLCSSSPYAGSCTHVKFRFRYNKLLKLGRVGRQDGCIGLWMASRTTSMRETGRLMGLESSWVGELRFGYWCCKFFIHGTNGIFTYICWFLMGTYGKCR